MLEYIEKNKRLLVLYYTVLRILGWILLCMGSVGYALLWMEYLQRIGRINLWGELEAVVDSAFVRSYIVCINMGLISLGFAQLVRSLCGSGYKMGLLLRYSDKIFYLGAIIVIWGVGVQVWIAATGLAGGNTSLDLRWLLSFMPTILYNSAKVLLLIGFGRFLKILIVILEGSKENPIRSTNTNCE
jgi:hypothetical protein